MNESKPSAVPMPHEIAVKGRKQMSITGVREVISFDERAVNVQTVNGELTVEGAALHIGVLDTDRGVVMLEGDPIDGVWYLGEERERDKHKGLLKKWHS